MYSAAAIGIRLRVSQQHPSELRTVLCLEQSRIQHRVQDVPLRSISRPPALGCGGRHRGEFGVDRSGDKRDGGPEGRAWLKEDPAAGAGGGEARAVGRGGGARPRHAVAPAADGREHGGAGGPGRRV